MNEQPKKIYTIEDNIKSIFFQNKDIMKALDEIKANLNISKPQSQHDDRPSF